MIDLLFALVALFLLSVPFGLAMAYFVTEGPDGLVSLFKTDRGLGLGWPVGVQEEDAPGWNWHPGDPAEPDGSPAGLPVEDRGARSALEPTYRSGARVSPYGVPPTPIGRVRVKFAGRHTTS